MGKNIKKSEDDESSYFKEHSAEHLLFGALKRQNHDIIVEKIQLSSNESKLFVKGDLSFDDLMNAQECANQQIEKDLKIDEHFIKKGEKTSARISKRINAEDIRIIQIGDFDSAACCGKHAKSLGEIGMIAISSAKKESKSIWKLGFLIGNKAKYFSLKNSINLQKISSFLNETEEKLQERIAGLIEENKSAKSLIKNLSKSFLKSHEFDFHEGLAIECLDYIDSSEIIKKISEMPDNKSILAFSNDLAIFKGNFSEEMAKILKSEFGSKGGGNKIMAFKIKKEDIEKIKQRAKSLKHSI